MGVPDDLCRSLKEMRVAAKRSHEFLLGGYAAIRHVAVEANPVNLVTDLECINRQIGGLHRVELEAQALG